MRMFLPAALALAAYLACPAADAAKLSKADVIHDLDAFASRLRAESSYLGLRDEARPFEAIEEFKSRLPDRITTAEFARELRKILSPIGDCHSSVSTEAEDREDGLWLPFRLAIAEGGIIAVRRDNSGFVMPGHPYLVAIDGKPLADWMAAAAAYAPVGSASQNLVASLQGIRRIDVLRNDLGIPASSDVALVFADADGNREETTLPARDRFSNFARIRLGDSRRIGDIGYLRIASMDNDKVPEARRLMEEFRDTKGLVIDVRDNSGGRYGLLLALFGYFQPPGTEPFVCNIAAYRLSPRFRDNHIAHRPTHRREWDGWSEAELAAIDAARETFEPAFPLPAGRFSDLHFMVLKRADDQFHYDRPVIVLSNESCFSATDGFLAAFSELPNVTLMGAPSRGGSGSARSRDLPRSGISVRLSTMASFRPCGRPFEGIGVAVDVESQPPPDDFVNGGDSVLERALQRLRDATAAPESHAPNPLRPRAFGGKGAEGMKKEIPAAIKAARYRPSARGVQGFSF